MSKRRNKKWRNENRPAPGGHGGAGTQVVHLREMKITWDVLPDPAVERLPQAVKDRMGLLFEQIHTQPRVVLKEALDLAAAHPDVICFQNWVSVCYRSLGQKDRARKMTEKLMETHPTYLFARLSLVELLLEEGEYETAERLFFRDGISLQEIYPERKEFHITEVRSWFYTAGRVFVTSGNRAGAKSCADLLEEFEPGSPAAADLRRLLQPESMAAMKLLRLMREMKNLTFLDEE